MKALFRRAQARKVSLMICLLSANFKSNMSFSQQIKKFAQEISSSIPLVVCARSVIFSEILEVS